MKKIICLLAMSLIASEAMAEIRFSGFGSVVGAIAAGDDEIVDNEAGITATDAGVNGYHGDLSFETGSFFAIQADADLGDNLGATLQIMSRGKDDWEPEFSWAFLSYDVTDDWRILAGRQRVPFYLYSDYLDVSYAYHWISAPAQIYAPPFSSIDGLGSIYTHNFENSSLTGHFVIGQDTPSEGFQFENILGGALTFNYNDWLTLRVGRFQFDSTFEVEGTGPVFDGWRAAGFSDVADRLEVNDDEFIIYDYAMQIDYNDWMFIAEYSPIDVGDTFIGHLKPWMVSVGKRIDNVMLHATYGRYKIETPNYVLNDVPTGINPALDGLAQATQQGLLSGTAEDTPYYIVGARWDFHDSAALKFQYSAIEDNKNNSANLFQIALVTVF